MNAAPNDMITGLVVGTVLTCVLLGALVIAYLVGTTHWDTNQHYFPCAEDDVLAYSPRSTTHVVCISREDVYADLERRM